MTRPQASEDQEPAGAERQDGPTPRACGGSLAPLAPGFGLPASRSELTFLLSEARSLRCPLHRQEAHTDCPGA